MTALVTRLPFLRRRNGNGGSQTWTCDRCGAVNSNSVLTCAKCGG